MTSLLGKIFGGHAETPGEVSYKQAMKVSDELLERMRETSRSTDAARAIMADVWAQNHNVPFITTVFESVEEMKSGAEQKPVDK